MSCGVHLCRREFRVARFDLAQSIGLEAINKIVGFYSEAFAATHFNKRFSAIFLAQLDLQLFTSSW